MAPPSVLIFVSRKYMPISNGRGRLKVSLHVAKERRIELKVDSAGTAAYHAGEEPDERTIEVCQKHNIPIDHRARQVTKKDFEEFDYIFAADENNLMNLFRMSPRGRKAEVRLWGSYLDDKPIEDPYYGGKRGFESVYQQCLRLSNAFLDEMTKKESDDASEQQQ